MLIILSQRLFEPNACPLPLLLSVFLAANTRQHVLSTDPIWNEEAPSQPLNDWLLGFGNSVAQVVISILDASSDERSSLTARTQLRALRLEPLSVSRWEQGVLSPDDGLRLLWTPLWLALENGRNDLQFLRRVLPSTDRVALDGHIREGRIEVPLGGGTGELKCFLQELATVPGGGATSGANGTWIRRLRTFALFDRDALQADRTQPSSESSELLAICQSMATPQPFPGHQLERRTIENYLPFEALDAWVERGQSDRQKQQRRKLVNAFKSEDFGEHRRRCYAMKGGLLKDSSTEVRERHKGSENCRLPLGNAEVAAVFQGMTDIVRNRLKAGFGNSIAALYHDETIEDRWFHEVFIKDPRARAWREGLINSLWEAL